MPAYNFIRNFKYTRSYSYLIVIDYFEKTNLNDSFVEIEYWNGK